MAGASTDEIEGVEVAVRPALTASAADVLAADGYLLGTPANIGYMSGALKHFFDGIYYPCLEATQRRPYALYVHGNSDTTGAVRAVESITSGLSWRQARPPLSVIGPPSTADLENCWELGAVLAAELAGDHCGVRSWPRLRPGRRASPAAAPTATTTSGMTVRRGSGDAEWAVASSEPRKTRYAPMIRAPVARLTPPSR